MLPILTQAERQARAEAIRARFTPAYLQTFRQRCDPLADAAVAELFTETVRGLYPRGQTNLLSACRARAYEGGPACLAFLRETRQMPEWVCLDDFRAGQELFGRNGVLTFLVGVSVLVASYGGAKDNKVLTLSGRLSQESAFRRAVETAQFTLDCVAPDGLREHGRGFEAILQVRLLHARVRQLCRRQGYDIARYDEPVNQEAMCGAIMLFSHGVIRALEQLGVVVSQEEKESYHALWRYGGYLMGVELELLPGSHAEEAALFDCQQYDYRPDNDTTQLYEHTVQGIAQGARGLPLWLTVCGGALMQSRAFLDSFVGLTISRHLADYLHIQPTWEWQAVFGVAKPVLGGASRLQQRFPWLKTLTYHTQARLMQAIVTALLAGAPAQFNHPGALAA